MHRAEKMICLAEAEIQNFGAFYIKMEQQNNQYRPMSASFWDTFVLFRTSFSFDFELHKNILLEYPERISIGLFV